MMCECVISPSCVSLRGLSASKPSRVALLMTREWSWGRRISCPSRSTPRPLGALGKGEAKEAEAGGGQLLRQPQPPRTAGGPPEGGPWPEKDIVLACGGRGSSAEAGVATGGGAQRGRCSSAEAGGARATGGGAQRGRCSSAVHGRWGRHSQTHSQ